MNKSMQAIQKAIDRQQSYYSKLWDEDVFAPDQSEYLLKLDDLPDLHYLDETRTLCFAGEPHFRDWQCQRFFTSLDDALAGGRSNWALAGYSLRKHGGLQLIFLPRYSDRFSDDADDALTEYLAEDDEDKRAELAKRSMDRLYSQYGVKLAIRGEYQLWIDDGSDRSAHIVFGHNHCVRMLTVQDGRKREKVTYWLEGRRSPQIVMYA